MNEYSRIEEEKCTLMPYKMPLELAVISENSVNTVFYSVPEELVGRIVTVKKYHDEICVFYDNKEVCKHKRAFGNGTCRVTYIIT